MPVWLEIREYRNVSAKPLRGRASHGIGCASLLLDRLTDRLGRCTVHNGVVSYPPAASCENATKMARVVVGFERTARKCHGRSASRRASSEPESGAAALSLGFGLTVGSYYWAMSVQREVRPTVRKRQAQVGIQTDPIGLLPQHSMEGRTQPWYMRNTRISLPLTKHGLLGTARSS
jgi:hypothetical protein